MARAARTQSLSTSSSAQILRLGDFRKAAEEPSTPKFIYVSITVSEAHESALRRAVTGSCGTEVSCIKIEQIPRKQQSRLWFCLLPDALEKAVHAIIASLPSAEFGSITANWP